MDVDGNSVSAKTATITD